MSGDTLSCSKPRLSPFEAVVFLTLGALKKSKKSQIPIRCFQKVNVGAITVREMSNLLRRSGGIRRSLTTLDRKAYDVAVVGGGVIGSWAAVSAGKRRKTVCLIEQFRRGHTMGSSHGDGRIWRKAYEEDVRFFITLYHLASITFWL